MSWWCVSYKQWLYAPTLHFCISPTRGADLQEISVHMVLPAQNALAWEGMYFIICSIVIQLIWILQLVWCWFIHWPSDWLFPASSTEVPQIHVVGWLGCFYPSCFRLLVSYCHVAKSRRWAIPSQIGTIIIHFNPRFVRFPLFLIVYFFRFGLGMLCSLL